MLEAVAGVVRSWSDGDGWGVIDAPATPGGCFAVVDMPGYRALRPGQTVVFDAIPMDVEGCSWQATRIVPSGGQPTSTG